MTLIFQNNINSPGVHIIIIGCGKYSSLKLKTLKSPILSARSIAKWFLTEYYSPSPNLELRSINLLLSGYNEDHPELIEENFKCNEKQIDIMIENANLDNCDKEINKWYEYGDHHKENTVIFFFFGHGIKKNFQTLLHVVDSLTKPRNLYQDSINFTDMYNGMASCKANSQIFFIDACLTNQITLNQ